MQRNIIWKGLEYHSHENCLIDESEQGIKIQSTIVGHYEGEPYLVNYQLETNTQWVTQKLDINYRLRNRQETVQLRSDMQGHWWLQDERAPAFDGCMDVDMTLTCLTNTLPIRRLDFNAQPTHLIKVVYVNILDFSVLPIQQQYTRLDDDRYRYENVPNDFEAVIAVDNTGLVTRYPSLFERRAVVQSHY